MEASGSQVSKRASPKSRYFFITAASLFPMLAVLGFMPSYILMRAGEITIHWSTHVHGTLMAGWLAMFFVQSWLALTGNFKFHRALGAYAVALGAIIWCSMGIASARALIGNAAPRDHFLFDVLVVQLYVMLMFAVFFTWAILARRNGAAHKRLMFLATLVLLQAAIDRIPVLQGGMTGFMFLDLLVLPLFVFDWITLKRVHRVTWMALPMLIGAQAAVLATFGSPAWHSFWFGLVSKYY